MKTDKYVKGEEVGTRQLILKSAGKFFLEYGYQAAPLRKIASEAGFTPGALYGYFSSKEELFYALTDSMVERLMKVLDRMKWMLCLKKSGFGRWEISTIPIYRKSWMFCFRIVRQ